MIHLSAPLLCYNRKVELAQTPPVHAIDLLKWRELDYSDTNMAIYTHVRAYMDLLLEWATLSSKHKLQSLL